MRTTGVVTWFDRTTGTGEVLLDDGECVGIRTAQTAACDPAEPAARAFAGRRRDLRPDVAAAFRAGTWGDGGRDY